MCSKLSCRSTHCESKNNTYHGNRCEPCTSCTHSLQLSRSKESKIALCCWKRVSSNASDGSTLNQRGLFLLLLELLQGVAHAAGVVIHQHAALPAAQALPQCPIARALRLCLLPAMPVCVLTKPEQGIFCCSPSAYPTQ